MMKLFKLLLAFILLTKLIVINPAFASASLVSVSDNGEIIINVLSVEDSIELDITKSSNLEVTGVVDGKPDPKAKIALLKDGEKIRLDVISPSGNRSLDVTEIESNVIEIEERPEVERLSIRVSGGKFLIEQGGIVAETEMAINVNPESASITLETPSGYKFLSILPKEAVSTILRSKFINRINIDRRIRITEEEKDLAYEIEGDRVIDIFKVVDYSIPVSAKVSASTGEVLFVNQPIWLKLINAILI